jgi:hypothetical protein
MLPLAGSLTAAAPEPPRDPELPNDTDESMRPRDREPPAP